MTEVDEIEAALKDPVNSWFNSNQQLAFQRLVRIARSAELLARSVELHRAGLLAVRPPPPRGAPGAEPTPPIGRDHA